MFLQKNNIAFSVFIILLLLSESVVAKNRSFVEVAAEISPVGPTYLTLSFLEDNRIFTGIIDNRILYNYIKHKIKDKKDFIKLLDRSISKKIPIKLAKNSPLLKNIYLLNNQYCNEIIKRDIKYIKKKYFIQNMCVLKKNSQEYWCIIYILFNKKILCSTDDETGSLITDFKVYK